MVKAVTYRGPQLREVAFPLGGIGAGCVSLEGRGSLRDWEIYNRPAKGTLLDFTFPVLSCQEEGAPSQTRTVQGPFNRDFGGGGFGISRAQANGLPCFASTVFRGRFPFAHVEFEQPNYPLQVSLRAFSPFIPLDHDSSAMPVACLTYTLRNRTKRPVRATLAWSMNNPVGQGVPISSEDPNKALNTFRNTFPSGAHCRGIYFENARFAPDDHRHGTAALTTSWTDITYTTSWLRDVGWFDSTHHFWDTFSKDGQLGDEHPYTTPGSRSAGTLGLCVTLAPGQSADLPFLISWCFPNFTKYWGEDDKKESDRPKWKNDYARRYPTAWDAAEDFFARRTELEGKTEAFADALWNSSLPMEVIESIANTASILHSPTCLRLQDGTFYGWEGCGDNNGCCEGSCTHVWNYALTQAMLFPDLHRTMRRAEYQYSFEAGEHGKHGGVVFRLPLPLGKPTHPFDPKSNWHHAASDGQLGGIVQLYRDWRFSGDEDYLRFMWPHAKKALEYAWHQWDRDKDGLVDGDQHNTYDINFQGPNPLTQCFYLAALLAGSKIARHLGDNVSADAYERLYHAGRSKTQKELFRGEYLVQTFDCLKPDAPKYQHGIGCLSDQVFGQLAAHVAGLGYILDESVVKSCIAAVFKHNFRGPLGDHCNPQRIYAILDESGLLLCTWPNGGRPAYPFPYSDEVWSGIEYQVASHLMYEGLVDEGLTIVKAVRQRHDGKRRNPFNEFECGHHYARALASWGMLTALSGFRYDAVDKTLYLTPRTGPLAKCLFTTGSAWGTFALDDASLTLKPLHGELVIERVVLSDRTLDIAPAQQAVRAGKTWKVSLT